MTHRGTEREDTRSVVDLRRVRRGRSETVFVARAPRAVDPSSWQRCDESTLVRRWMDCGLARPNRSQCTRGRQAVCSRSRANHLVAFRPIRVPAAGLYSACVPRSEDPWTAGGPRAASVEAEEDHGVTGWRLKGWLSKGEWSFAFLFLATRTYAIARRRRVEEIELLIEPVGCVKGARVASVGKVVGA